MICFVFLEHVVHMPSFIYFMLIVHVGFNPCKLLPMKDSIYADVLSGIC